MSQQPGWLTRLTGRVCECINLLDDLPVGCHYHHEKDLFEVSLFLAPTEFVGGPHDGQRVPANFMVDVRQLIAVFDVLETASWQAHRIDGTDDLGAHFAIIGIYEGRNIWLRILAEAPPQIEPGRFANVLEQTYEDVWANE